MTQSHPEGTRRLGVIGTENSHAGLIVRHLNEENLFGGWRVTALHGPDPDRNAELVAAGHTADVDPAVHESHVDMLGVVDAVIVTDRDGGVHRRHSTPFLENGIPVFVDKPLATTVDDAQQIIDSAEANGALMTSFSALRWAPTTQSLASLIAQGQLRPAAAFAVGPAEIESEHGGVFYYGIHPVEAVCAALPGEFGPVSVSRSEETLVIETSVGGVHLTIALLEPIGDDWAPFHLSVAGRNEVEGGDIVLDSDYLVPGLNLFFEMIDKGVAPVTPAELLRPVVLLDAIRSALKGSPIA